MATRVLAIEYPPISFLAFDPQNPQSHDKKRIRKLASSTRTFGFNVPVLVDAQLQVIPGPGRAFAWKRLGIAQISVIRLGHLSENQIRAFKIADNMLTGNAEWEIALNPGYSSGDRKTFKQHECENGDVGE